MNAESAESSGGKKGLPLAGNTTRCAECGAPIPEGGSCRDNFHALLALEAEVPGAAGSITHFLTVATYNLQHPTSLSFALGAIQGLRRLHQKALDGKVTIEEMRRTARAGARQAGRVTRRAGEPEFSWPRGAWTVTCVDVCAGGAAEYETRVRHWALSVRETLDRELGPVPGSH